MNNKTWYLLTCTLIMITPVVADISVKGISQFNNQYVIDNTDKFQNYTFLTSSEIWGFEYPKLVVNGSFGGGYKLDGFVLHALKSTDISPGVREQLTREDSEKENLTSYFESSPLATSDILLPVSVGMNDTIPLNNITVFLQINNIEGKNLSISELKTVYGYLNGTSEEIIPQMDSAQTEADLLTGSGQMLSIESLTDSL